MDRGMALLLDMDPCWLPILLVVLMLLPLRLWIKSILLANSLELFEVVVGEATSSEGEGALPVVISHS